MPSIKSVILYTLAGIGVYLLYKKYIRSGPGILGLGRHGGHGGHHGHGGRGRGYGSGYGLVWEGYYPGEDIILTDIDLPDIEDDLDSEDSDE